MNYATYIALIPLLPLATFVLLGLFGRKYFNKSSGIIGTTSILASTALSLYVAYQYFFIDGKVNGVYQQIIAFKYNWLRFSPDVSIDMGRALQGKWQPFAWHSQQATACRCPSIGVLHAVHVVDALLAGVSVRWVF